MFLNQPLHEGILFFLINYLYINYDSTFHVLQLATLHQQLGLLATISLFMCYVH